MWPLYKLYFIFNHFFIFKFYLFLIYFINLILWTWAWALIFHVLWNVVLWTFFNDLKMKIHSCSSCLRKQEVELTWPSGPSLPTPGLKRNCLVLFCFFIITSSMKFTPCICTSMQRGHPVFVFKQWIQLILTKCLLYAWPHMKRFECNISFIPLPNVKGSFHHYFHFTGKKT